MTDAERIFGESRFVLAGRLQRNRRAESTTPETNRDRCPECGTTDLQPTNNKPAGPDPESDYRCRDCGAAVDEPVVRGDAA